MFTGIVKELGRVRRISGLGNIYKLSIESRDISASAIIGDSLSVNGTCLTITGKNKNILEFDVMAETMRKTCLGRLRVDDAVNLEDALKAGGPMGGHFVTGHIDCTGKVKHAKRIGTDVSLEITFPGIYKNLVAEKGSIAIDGVSLTIGRAAEDSVTLYIIPHTLKETTLGSKNTGDEVNIEFDIIGKYIAAYCSNRKIFDK